MPPRRQVQRSSRNYHEGDLILSVVVKELSFAIIKQAFGRFEKQWRYKKGKMSLETLIFACQRRFFKVFVLLLYLDRGNSIQNIRNKEALLHVYRWPSNNPIES